MKFSTSGTRALRLSLRVGGLIAIGVGACRLDMARRDGRGRGFLG
jgi:hypothetical protein